MKAKKLWLLFLSLGLCSATILVERFLCPVPEWMAIGAIVIAIVALIIFMVQNRNNAK